MAWHDARMKKIIALATFALSTTILSPAIANDSTAAIGLGGLELTRNDSISMDSEDLFLSRKKVTVKYRFTNNSAKDIETLVSFPLPPMPSGLEGYMDMPAFTNWKEQIEFKTLVDGKPVALDYRETYVITDSKDGKDVRKRVESLGWPLRYWEDYEFDQKYLEKLDNAQKAKLVKEGLLRKEADSDYYSPNWQMQAHITRKQKFPAGKTIVVEHSYKPIAGGSVGGALIPEYRKDGGDYFKEYAASYCIDKSFLAGFDKRYIAEKKKAAKRGDEYGVAYTEHWLEYALKPGANWKGPIKDFRLVVEKDKPENLLSFCMTGVRKISPTQFEVRKTNFEPKDDIRILIAEFYDPNAS